MDINEENAIGQLFDGYLQRLEDRGCRKAVLRKAVSPRRGVVREAIAVWKDKYAYEPLEDLERRGIHIMVGPIIPPTYIGYYGLLEMARRSDRESDYSDIKFCDISNLVPTPSGLYWIFDLQIGERIQNIIEAKSLWKVFQERGRLPLVASEAINLRILTNICLEDYVSILAVGSRVDWDLEMPCINPHDVVPLLGSMAPGFQCGILFAPSYGSRAEFFESS